MYKCLDCGSVFSIPSLLIEDNGEKIAMCPLCDDGDVEVVHSCQECGEYFMEQELTEGFCKDCRLEISKRFSSFMDSFTTPERDLINTLYDGERL